VLVSQRKPVGRARDHPNGKPLVRELISVAKAGGGWVDCDWPHPQTKKLEGKSTYARKLTNYDGWVGVGVYR
jgi:cytochrome c